MSVVSTSEISDGDQSSSDSNLDNSIKSDSNNEELILEDGSSDGPSDGASEKVNDEPSVVKDSSDSSDASSNDDKASGSSSDASSNDDKASGSSSDSSSNDDKASDSSSDASATPASDDSSDCNLTITKEGDKKVKVGETVTWKITVKNSLNKAENVTVKEKLPKGFELVSAKASKGTYDEKTGSWKIGNLNKSESATLTIKAKAKKAGTFTNKAELSTDSKNLNENTTVKADVEVVSKKKAAVKKTKDKKDKKVSKVKKAKEKIKAKQSKTNNTNKTNNKKVDLKHAGNPIMVILISIFTVFGLSILKKQ